MSLCEPRKLGSWTGKTNIITLWREVREEQGTDPELCTARGGMDLLWDALLSKQLDVEPSGILWSWAWRTTKGCLATCNADPLPCCSLAKHLGDIPRTPSKGLPSKVLTVSLWDSEGSKLCCTGMDSQFMWSCYLGALGLEGMGGLGWCVPKTGKETGLQQETGASAKSNSKSASVSAKFNKGLPGCRRVFDTQVIRA